MRLSATKLESFRLYKTADWMTFEKFVDQIMGVPRTIEELYNMERGKALHLIFEESKLWRGNDNVSHLGDTVFHFSGLDKAWPFIPQNGQPEVKVEMEFNGVQLVAIIDHVHGLKGYEYKTSSKPFDVSKYQDSAQWKVLLHVLGLHEIEYQVYTLKDTKEGTWIDDVNTFSVFRYPGLERDLTELVGEFCEFIKTHKLEKCFARKVAV